MRAKSLSPAIIALLSGALLFLATPTLPALAQRNKGTLPDASQLRVKFIQAFADNFELVQDEFRTRSNERGGGTYWLAFVKPKHPGYFSLQYRYKYSEPLYSHVEHEIHLDVGQKGCRRGVPDYGAHTRFCMGDTIIIPVIVNSFTEHEFKLVRANALDGETEDLLERGHPRPETLDTSEVPNPAADNLRYLGSASHKQQHRALGYTLVAHATFEALRAGRFNLEVSADYPQLNPDEDEVKTTQRPLSSKVAAGKPIIVLDRNTPLTLLASREEVRGFSVGPNGSEYESSWSGNTYMVNLVFMQPGDKLTIQYASMRRSGEQERKELTAGRFDEVESIRPLIKKHPFAVDPSYDFTEWLIPYLP